MFHTPTPILEIEPLTLDEAIAFLRRKGTRVHVYSPDLDEHVPSTKGFVLARLVAWADRLTLNAWGDHLLIG
jgi:hypothetical protein